MPFAGNSVATIQFHREYQLEPGDREGPAPVVRVSAKRQKAPLVLSPEEVKLGLAQLEFRDQFLVFLGWRLGNPSRELGVRRWLDCEFENINFSAQHSYYLRRAGHLMSTKTEAPAKLLPMHPSLKQVLLEWRSQSLYNQPGDFVFPSERLKGSKPLDLASVLKKKISTGVQEDRHHGSGLAHISAHGGNHAGRDGRTPTNDPGLLAPREFACNQQVSSGNDNEQAFGTRKIGGRHSARGVLSASKSTLIH